MSRCLKTAKCIVVGVRFLNCIPGEGVGGGEGEGDVVFPPMCMRTSRKSSDHSLSLSGMRSFAA
eukprot:1149604-Pelagomonas_calceolata.AAC.4